jgi:hypothetical protein
MIRSSAEIFEQHIFDPLNSDPLETVTRVDAMVAT